MGSGSAVFFRDQGSGCTILRDQGPKFATLSESRIRNLSTKKGSAMTRHTYHNSLREDLAIS